MWSSQIGKSCLLRCSAIDLFQSIRITLLAGKHDPVHEKKELFVKR